MYRSVLTSAYVSHTVLDMNSTEIRQILTGTFADPADRAYWVEKLAKVERAEQVVVTGCVRLPNMEVA